MSSTPFTCCSIGAAIVSATSCAPAPGKVQSTWMLGGVTYGNWLRGRVKKERPPASVISTDRTVAKTGRWMKKRENTGRLNFKARYYRPPTEVTVVLGVVDGSTVAGWSV